MLTIRKTPSSRVRRGGRGICCFFFLAVVALSALTARAQTIPRVSATFKTPENKTPLAAGLKVVATLHDSMGNAVSAYGTVDFVPFDTSGNKVTSILCGAKTYVPQNVRGWIKSDGTLMDRAAAAGVDLVPTTGCLPANTKMRATIIFPASTNAHRAESTWVESKSVPQAASADWGSL